MMVLLSESARVLAARGLTLSRRRLRQHSFKTFSTFAVAHARVKVGSFQKPIGENMTYVIYKDGAGHWRWRLRAGNNRIIADSGESYNNRADCLSAIDLVKGSGSAPVQDA